MTTPQLGVGISPLGGGAYGLGTPATAPTPGGAVNRSATGLQLGSVALSTDADTRGQYIFDEFGRRTGMPDAQHMVILAIRTEFGSCCVQTLGQKFKEIRKITDAFAKEQRARVDECLSDLISRKLVRVDAVEADGRNGMPARTVIRLQDLTTNTPIDLAI